MVFLLRKMTTGREILIAGIPGSSFTTIALPIDWQICHRSDIFLLGHNRRLHGDSNTERLHAQRDVPPGNHFGAAQAVAPSL